jgi:hypothetical protein
MSAASRAGFASRDVRGAALAIRTFGASAPLKQFTAVNV